MSNPDASVLTNSDLNAFLYSEIGDELNGSPLTVLSVLARLGKDPWAEAGRWSKLPRAAIIDSLAGSIAQMPLCPLGLAEARSTATRLSWLLPSHAQLVDRSGEVISAGLWIPLIVFCAALVLWVVFEVKSPAAVDAPLGETIGSPTVPAQ
jgi:hypothetical protein